MIVCHCKEVTYDEIRLYLQENPKATFNEVKKGTGASTGCGRCAYSVRKVMESIQTEVLVKKEK